MAYAREILNLLAMHFGNYNENSNIGKILKVIEYTDEDFLQTCEDIKNILDLDQAYGKNLDLIHGKNKDLLRGDLSDLKYIERLKLETVVNNSDGDIETLEQAAIALFGDDFRGITEIDNARISTLLLLNSQSLPNETYERAVTAGVDNEYNLLDEEEIINVVSEGTVMQKFIFFECGTASCTRTAGSLF